MDEGRIKDELETRSTEDEMDHGMEEDNVEDNHETEGFNTIYIKEEIDHDMELEDKHEENVENELQDNVKDEHETEEFKTIFIKEEAIFSDEEHLDGVDDDVSEDPFQLDEGEQLPESNEKLNSVGSLLKTSFESRPVQEQIKIKALGRPTPDLSDLVQIDKSNNRAYSRRFSVDLYKKHSWLCGCETRLALFCFPCLLFGGENTWTKFGFKDMNHVPIHLKRHESTSLHMKNRLKLAFLGGTNILEKTNKTRGENVSLHNEKVRNNRYVLNIIINCIRFCGVFELALKGHDDNESKPGILRRLIDFSAEIDSAMKVHLESAEFFRESSETIQNELLNVMLEVCREKISQEMNDAKFLALIVDEITDVAYDAQMVVIYRYIVNNRPVERFWTFVNIPQGAPALATCVLDQLKLHNLNEKFIAQTYNGMSMMSGSTNLVQTSVKKAYPSAQFIHYHAHQVHLVMMRSASVIRDVRIFFANVLGLCSFFSTSVERTSVLDEIVKKRLGRPAPTRWNFDSYSMLTIHDHRLDLINCMNTILNSRDFVDYNTICEASGYLGVLGKESFIFWLSFFSKIFSLIEILSSQLHRVDVDSTEVEKSLSTFEEYVLKIRNDFKIDASTSGETNGNKPSSRKRKNDRTEWQREAREVCDVIICQSKERFSYTAHLVADSLFAPDRFPAYEQQFPEDKLNTVCSAYKILDMEKLRAELETIYSAVEFRAMAGAVALYRFLKGDEFHEMFGEIVQLLEIIITIPMTTDDEERCFPALKNVRTFLSNSLDQDEQLLSALAMLSIERDLVMEIPDFNQKVIEKFAQLEDRKADFLFK